MIIQNQASPVSHYGNMHCKDSLFDNTVPVKTEMKNEHRVKKSD